MTGANSVQTEQTFVDSLVWRLVPKAVWLGLVAILLVVVIVLATVTTDGMWIGTGFRSLANNLVAPALIIPPMIIVIASGGVDLSVGSVIGVVAVTMAALLDSGRGLVVAIMVGILLAVAVGVINGLLVGLARVHSALVTLGMATLLRGLSLIITNGYYIVAEPAEVLASLALPGLLLALFLTIGIVVLSELAPFARKRYLGLRDDTHWLQRLALSGLPYVLSSAMAGLAGAIFLGRLAAGHPLMGSGMEIEVILIVLLGGTVYGGGLVNGIGAILAAATVVLAKNALILSDLSLWQQGIQGIGVLVFGLLCQLYYTILNWAFKRSKGKETPVVIDRE